MIRSKKLFVIMWLYIGVLGEIMLQTGKYINDIILIYGGYVTLFIGIFYIVSILSKEDKTILEEIKKRVYWYIWTSYRVIFIAILIVLCPIFIPLSLSGAIAGIRNFDIPEDAIQIAIDRERELLVIPKEYPIIYRILDGQGTQTGWSRNDSNTLTFTITFDKRSLSNGFVTHEMFHICRIVNSPEYNGGINRIQYWYLEEQLAELYAAGIRIGC